MSFQTGLKFLSALLLCACHGNIGDLAPQPAPPVDPPIDPPINPPPMMPPGLVCTATLAPGRTPIHRLTRLEYDRTVRDLAGDDSGFAAAFPIDHGEAGFDHVSDTQTVSLLHAEKYEEAASLIAQGIWSREFDRGVSKRWEAEVRSETPGNELLLQSCCGSPMYNNVVANGARGFWAYYRIYTVTELDREADYTITARAWTENADTSTTAARPLNLQLLFNEQPIATVRLTATRDAPQRVVGTVHVETPGYHRIDVQLEDPTIYSNPPDAPRVWVDWFLVERAPMRSIEPPRVRICELDSDPPNGCLRRTFERFVRRAYRRPASPDELDRLQSLYVAALAAGDGEREAFEEVLTAVLLSPHFLYRVELDPDLDSTAAHDLGAHELAARLSYFLTATMPDEALASRADDGSIRDPNVLASESDRLLASNESTAMVDNMGEQWMSTRALDVVSPSPDLYPDFDDALLRSMGEEANRFFTAVFREDRPARELLEARFTFLNDRLAAHYGVPLPGSETPVRVELETRERGGVLGLASVLAVNSTPARPSEVLRGKWVLSQLLCAAPPPPPFNVPPLSSSPGTTPREQLEEHAKNPACATCHARMDPIGFALDGFDADGSRRTRDRQGRDIDDSAVFADGTHVRGMDELRAYLAMSDKLEPCLAEHVLVYALARSPAHDDRCEARAIAARTPRASFKDLVHEVVASPNFRQRQAEGLRP